MLELLAAVAVIVMMTRIADADGQSSILWCGVTIVVVLGSLFLIPLPFLRLLIAGGVVFGLMILNKMRAVS